MLPAPATAAAAVDTEPSSAAAFTMHPIGTVRSPFKQKFGIPRQPHLAPTAQATIELHPPFNTPDAVKGLAEWSHVWVTFVFHKTMRAVDEWQSHLVRPPRLGGRTRVGVFASRATYRPNPIGLSACKLDTVHVRPDGVLIVLSGIDLLDGTPVLDIKPYLPYADRIEDASGSYAPLPPTVVPVDFTDVATRQLADRAEMGGSHNRQLRQLIVEVLQQDPRPPARSDAPGGDDREYGVFLYDVNVSFTMSDAGALVTNVVPAPPEETSDVSDEAVVARKGAPRRGGPRPQAQDRRTADAPPKDDPEGRQLSKEELIERRLAKKREKKLARQAARERAGERQRQNREASRKGDLRASGQVVPKATESTSEEAKVRVFRYPVTTLEEFAKWIVSEDDSIMVFNKPADVVCHPSKNGPLSSLVGAAREYTKLEKVHLIARLDRETSGVVLVAKDPECAARHQRAIEGRNALKLYFALLVGNVAEAITVDQPLGKDKESPAWIKDVVAPNDPEARPAVTRFRRCVSVGNYTLVAVTPITGRKHQIRAHAEWLGAPILGDKMYGRDRGISYVRFVESGWSPALEAELEVDRHMLHCALIDVGDAGGRYTAQPPDDFVAACETRLSLGRDELSRIFETELALIQHQPSKDIRT